MIFERKYLYLTLSIFAIGTEIVVPIPSQAQIIPDASLGSESSVVTPTNNLPQPVSPSTPTLNTPPLGSPPLGSPPPGSPPPGSPPPIRENATPDLPEITEQFLIEGGAIRDSNIFHSFREFNINNGQQINFANPEGIVNILTRITGDNSSNIFGALGVNGNANLFLINPNGIVFGENAIINLNGSFFASTAEQIDFTDGGSFSAVNPAAPPLLTVNIPVGVQLGNSPASIQLEKTRIDARDVTLLGGEINLKQTTFNAPGGEITFGSLAEAGTVNFNSEFPLDIARGDIQIGDRSLINVMAAGGGNITVNAGNLTLIDSDFQAGIGEGLGDTQAIAGDIYFDVTENIVLNNSNINNNLELGSIGKGGVIKIDTANLILTDSRIATTAKSTGNGGNVVVNVDNQLEVFSSPKNGQEDTPGNPGGRKGIFSTVVPDAVGNGGNIDVTASEITLLGLGGIDSSTVGIGNAGNIQIQSDRLTIDDGAGVFANTGGIGDGGEIAIDATEFIEISDKQIPNLNPDGKPLPGGIIADIRRDAKGNGGNISLNTGRLSVSEGAIITTDSKGSGNAGDINITTRDLVEVVGRNEGGFPSQIVSAVRRNASGNGGDVAIATNNFIVRDGATINVGTQSIGNSGDLSVLASGRVEIEGISTAGVSSRMVAQVGEAATGDGGDIFLVAENLNIADGGQISASTLGFGEGGSVTVEVSNDISISGYVPLFDESDTPGLSPFIRNSQQDFIPSGIFAASPGLGDANALEISANSLSLSYGGQLSVSSQQQGAAGNLTASAEDLSLNNATISAETIEGEAANIFLKSSVLQLRNQSSITTNATQTATGGNIKIDTDTLLALNNSDITANAEDNFGGRISIEAQGVFGTQIRSDRTSGSDITASSQLGAEFSGTVDIDLSNADPAAGIIKLPDNVVDASQQITSSCNLGTDNSFVLTGRGGIAPNPQEFLRGQTILQDWRLTSSQTQLPIEQTSISKIRDRPEVIEAQKWIVNSKGKVELVADLAQSDRGFWSKSLKCTS